MTALKAADMYDPAPSHTPTPAQLSRIATRQQEADARALKRRPSLTRRGSFGDPAHIPAKPKLTAAQIASIAARRQQVSTPRLGPVRRLTGLPAHQSNVCALKTYMATTCHHRVGGGALPVEQASVIQQEPVFWLEHPTSGHGLDGASDVHGRGGTRTSGHGRTGKASDREGQGQGQGAARSEHEGVPTATTFARLLGS